jgi:acyl carrier protein
MFDERLINIFREVFNNPDLVITEETSAIDVPDWDSFNHLNLIMEIEDEYSVSFTTKEVGQMVRVADLVKLLQDRNQLR